MAVADRQPDASVAHRREGLRTVSRMGLDEDGPPGAGPGPARSGSPGSASIAPGSAGTGTGTNTPSPWRRPIPAGLAIRPSTGVTFRRTSARIMVKAALRTVFGGRSRE